MNISNDNAFVQFSNLILDDTKIVGFTKEDGEYLQTFTILEKLSMNSCSLRNLNNFPDNLKMVKVSNS